MTVYSSVSAHLFAYEPLVFDHLKAVADCGYRQVELWAMRPHLDYEDDETITHLKGWLKDLGIMAASFHAPFYAHFEEARAGNWLSLSAPDEDLRRKTLALTEIAMRTMADLGAQIAVLHPGGPSPAGETDTFDGLRGSLETLLPLADELDLILAVENIPAPMGKPGPLAEFVTTFDHPPRENLSRRRSCQHHRWKNIKTAFRHLAPLAAATHIHDNDGEKDAHLVPGRGNIAWPPLWKALGDAGYTGPITYELRRDGESSYAETLSELGRSTPPHTLDNFPVNGHTRESVR